MKQIVDYPWSVSFLSVPLVYAYLLLSIGNKARVKSYRVSCCRLQILLSVSTHGCSEPLQKITRIASQLLLWGVVRKSDVTARTDNKQKVWEWKRYCGTHI